MHSIHRICTGEMILELKMDTVLNGPAYRELAEQVLGDGVEVRALAT